jgi:hypothetical protein
VFGNAHGTYYGTGNKSVFGWYGYALNKIIWAIAATIQVLDSSVRSRTMARSYAEVSTVIELLDKALGRVYVISAFIELLDSRTTSMARVVMLGESVLISEVARRFYVILETLVYGGIRFKALLRGTFRANRQ